MKIPHQLWSSRKQLQEDHETCIDDLPLPIIIHIISFLPTLDAIRTTVVASTWRNLWHSIPNLEFDMTSFHSKLPDMSIHDARERFAGFVSKALSQRRDNEFLLQKFKLRFRYRNNSHIRSYIDSWLKILTKCGVVELDLNFQLESYHQHPVIPIEEEDDDDDEHPPFHLYSPQFPNFIDCRVKVLKLFHVGVWIPAEALSNKFNSIREVLLSDFDSSDKDVEHLLGSCTNLESLCLGSARGCKNLKIASQKLKHFELFFFGVNVPESSVEICTPSLVSIKLTYVYVEKFSLKRTPSLVDAEVIFFQRIWWDFVYWTNVINCLAGVERLTVQHMWTWCSMPGVEQPITTIEQLEDIIPEGEEFLVPSFVPQDLYFALQPRQEVLLEFFRFHNLKHLELLTGFSTYDISGLRYLFEECPKLDSLVLINKYESYEDYEDGEDFEAGEDDNDQDEIDDEGEDDGMVDYAFCLPNLKFVEIKDFAANLNQMFVVHCLMYFGGALEKITAYPKIVNGVSPPPIVLFENLDPDST